MIMMENGDCLMHVYVKDYNLIQRLNFLMSSSARSNRGSTALLKDEVNLSLLRYKCGASTLGCRNKRNILFLLSFSSFLILMLDGISSNTTKYYVSTCYATNRLLVPPTSLKPFKKCLPDPRF